jgi:hypothetical protein
MPHQQSKKEKQTKKTGTFPKFAQAEGGDSLSFFVSPRINPFDPTMPSMSYIARFFKILRGKK